MVGLKCHAFDSLAVVGGQCVALYPEKPIFDIPGFPRIDAHELIDRLAAQASPFKPVYHLDSPVSVLEELADGGFRLANAAGVQVEAGAVVVAAGVGAFGPNRPPLDGIEQYEGKCVHYLVDERQSFRDRCVVIAGGGDSAVDWALSLAEVAASVRVVHRRDKFRCAPESERRLREAANAGRIELVVPYQLHALEGDGEKLSAILVRTLKGQERRLKADALLPFFGLSMDLGPIAEWGMALEQKHLAIDPATCETSRPGIYAIGDVTTYDGKLKLILTGFSEAATTAHAIRARLYPDEVRRWRYSTAIGVPA